MGGALNLSEGGARFISEQKKIQILEPKDLLQFFDLKDSNRVKIKD